MIKSLLHNEAKLNITFDDIRLKSNLTTNKAKKLTKKVFFFNILLVTETHSGVLGDIPGSVQMIPGSYKSDKPINTPGIDNIHIKCDCVDESILDGLRQPILCSFALSSFPGHELFKGPRIKLFKKINKKSVLSQLTF